MPNGGYVATLLLNVAREHLTARRQPDTIAAHWQFLSRTSAGRAIIKVDEVNMGRAMSVIHLSLHQTGLVDAAPWLAPDAAHRRLVAAYVTNRNMDDEQGLSLPTAWSLLPAPPPPIDLSSVRQGRDAHWKRMETGLMRQVPMTHNLEMYEPRAGHPLTSALDLWIRLAHAVDGRFVAASLGYVADAPAALIVENYRQPPGPGPFAAASFPHDEAFWYPTVAMSLDVRKKLPPGGVEWLRMRASTKAIRNGRHDIDVVVFDAAGDLVATSHHVAMVVDVQRNLASRRDDGAGDAPRSKV